MQNSLQNDPFIKKFKGGFIGILRWHQLDELWETLRAGKTDDWFIYHIGDQPPVSPAAEEKLDLFIHEVDKLLRQDHGENYCGIVYVDDKDTPGFIKIYDPNNLGHVCGSDGSPPPLPGWTLSKIPPIDLQAAMPPVNSRLKWWKKIFH